MLEEYKRSYYYNHYVKPFINMSKEELSKAPEFIIKEIELYKQLKNAKL